MHDSSEICKELNYCIMLPMISLLLTCLFVTNMSVSSSFCTEEIIRTKDGDEVLIIVQPREEEADVPRTPNTTTIEAWYSWSTSSVRASLANTGDSVQVEFNNLSTGEYYSFIINGNGSSVMPISGSSGYWTVSFTLSSGVIYDGCFIL